MYLTERATPADPGDESPRGGRVTRTVILLGVVSLLTDLSSEATGAVLPLYLTAVLGLSPMAYGVVDGLYQGATAVVRLLGGWVADRTDRPKPVAIVGYALSAVARFGMLLVTGLSGVLAVITADRLGKGLRTAPRDALIAASSDKAALGRAFGVHRSLDTAGAVLGPLVAFTVLMVLPDDYAAVFVVSCAAAVLGVAVLIMLVPNLRPTRDANPGALTVPRPSLRLLNAPAFRRLVAAAGLLGLLTISDGFLYLILQDRDDMAALWFPLLFVGTNAAFLALAIPFGRLADRIGRMRVFVGGYVLLLLAYLVAGSPWGGAGTTLLCLLLLGAFYAATDGVLAAATAALVPPSVRGSALATTQSVVAVARLVASLGFGFLWVTLGRVTAVYTVGVALAIAIPLAWLLVRRSETVAA